MEFGLSLKVEAGLEMSMGVELGFTLMEEEALARVIGVKLELSVKVDVEWGPNLMEELGISVA